jgi:histidyl-tRNA synthetase
MRTATSLRRQGWAVEYSLHPMPLGKQLDSARKAGADAAIIIRADGSLRKKHFESGEEEPFTFPNG